MAALVFYINSLSNIICSSSFCFPLLMFNALHLSLVEKENQRLIQKLNFSGLALLLSQGRENTVVLAANVVLCAFPD